MKFTNLHQHIPSWGFKYSTKNDSSGYASSIQYRFQFNYSMGGVRKYKILSEEAGMCTRWLTHQEILTHPYLNYETSRFHRGSFSYGFHTKEELLNHLAQFELIESLRD